MDDEDELVRGLREQISLEKDLEQAKLRLVDRYDFNLFDAFRIFDVDSRGAVNHFDLKYGLSDIGVFCTQEELDLFISRYDTNKDGRLRFSEFCEAFTPTDTYTATVLNRRGSNNMPIRYKRDDCFGEGTKGEFRQLWRTHFKVETANEYLRQKLAKRPGFNIFDAFAACDIDNDGKISKEEIQELIESRGYFVSAKEVANLVERFDHDKDGRISYSEFREEMVPKSPVRY